ncbi:hypothetical protein TVAG_383340 [Trichomonas vaginalis G3]|uniref:Uncharacterized protein n=1 Tax=Trichomonas vaginalis (strain ATCC PRA-98 / G3) TaxID=412133 RepID=A2FSG4_TRIV3|nr:proline-rich extensin signature family [Trichomonas vaginalis G3]EAX92161.1 hypothetical protein TVAG_383340 [Trichomonas vaginalis G3]KAI5538939.1 proline-rich extensin signature family [Trichomonas vaginalis G3]|eukprot:XP_001305091.1 hypothetical protein [Trichomonas vaginalis G3]
MFFGLLLQLTLQSQLKRMVLDYEWVGSLISLLIFVGICVLVTWCICRFCCHKCTPKQDHVLSGAGHNDQQRAQTVEVNVNTQPQPQYYSPDPNYYNQQQQYPQQPYPQQPYPPQQYPPQYADPYVPQPQPNPENPNGAPQYDPQQPYQGPPPQQYPPTYYPPPPPPSQPGQAPPDNDNPYNM